MSIPIMALPSPQQFAQLERIERLHVLAVAQAEWGLDDPRYRGLAGVHAAMLRGGRMGGDRP